MSEPEQPANTPLSGLLGLGISMEELLISEPIHSRKLVHSVISGLLSTRPWIEFPKNIRDHCDHAHCGGIRLHTEHSSESYSLGGFRYCYVSYLCTNCQETAKVFALKIEVKSGSTSSSAFCTKLYQEPSFGQPIPKKLFKVIGEDNREHFLQARRAIARGLGVGAYAYYRRIVENTKFELIASVLEVAKATNATKDQISLLEKAQKETQFSKALDMLQDVAAIPAVLLIDGHNPLALLHDLLSEGIHQLSDAECLERAKESEIILSEIAERMQIALTERKELKTAISSIMNRKNPVKGSTDSSDKKV